MNGVQDAREEVVNNITIYMMEQGIPATEAKNTLYMILSNYEVTSRCTELAEMRQDRNENMLKRFLIAKTVKGCTDRTINYYKTEIPKILNAIGKTVDDITPDDIRLYMAVRNRRDGVSNVTVGNEMRVLSSFLQWMRTEELISKNPMLRVDSIKQKKTKKEALTEEEIERIRLAAVGEREQMMIEVLLSTGCRVEEFVKIRIDEIDGDRILIHGKGQKDRYVYLNTKAKIMVERYLKERRDNNPYLNPGGKFGAVKMKKRDEQINWWKYPEHINGESHLEKETPAAILRKIAKKAGVEKANPHKFRMLTGTLSNV